MNSHHQIILKDMLSSLKCGDAINLKEVLEILNSSFEVNVQMKMVSILSAYVMLNDTNIDEIVTYNPIYDKINCILSNCAPKKITTALNFLSALLYVNDEASVRKLSLVMYAKNMIRSSGCLATMCDLFTSCMMYQDAWRSLCRCISEACRSVEANQSSCKHLIPMCVQRCSRQNMETVSVLQSLLQNHPSNIKIFIKANGLSMFQREFLQHDVCLELLANIAQSSNEAVALIVKTKICQHLRDFLHLYGTKSQLGQWATIVLYYTSRIEVTEHQRNSNNFDNKAQEPCLPNFEPLRTNVVNNENYNLQVTGNTTKFFQNVMKEVIQGGAFEENRRGKLKDIFATQMLINTGQRNANPARTPFHDMTNKNGRKTPHIQNRSSYADEVHRDRTLDLSFVRNKFLNNDRNTFLNNARNTFLNNGRNRFLNNGRNSLLDNNPTNTTSKIANSRVFSNYKKPIQNHRCKSSIYETTEKSESILGPLDTTNFKPIFSSTPKKRRVNESSILERQNDHNSSKFKLSRELKNRRIEKKRVSKTSEHSRIDKELKTRSISGRLFDAINTSCTSIVRTVKNIFKPKIEATETNRTKASEAEESSNKTPSRDTSSCSYSFTNYMRKRDAFLKSIDTIKSTDTLHDSKLEQVCDITNVGSNDSCKTCNDTTTLKRKLLHDDHLKRTLRKLKLGINLYGCDFKKISRTFWPNEAYMSPGVLYNLYRKLIIK